MKKILYLSVCFLILSCSSSDSNSSSSSNPTLVLPSKTVETNPDGVYTTIYNYDGNKILSGILTASNGIDTFTREGRYSYSGNLISQFEILDNSNLSEKTIYSYNSDNKLSSLIDLNYISSIGNKVVYTYNTDGTISSINYRGDLINQTTIVSNNLITINNGEVASLVEHIGTTTKTSVYTYDNKNAPFKNVTGMDKVSYGVVGTFSSAINHNIIQTTRTTNSSPGFTTTIQYNYNSSDYPTSETVTTNGTSNQSTQYYY